MEAGGGGGGGRGRQEAEVHAGGGPREAGPCGATNTLRCLVSEAGGEHGTHPLLLEVRTVEVAPPELASGGGWSRAGRLQAGGALRAEPWATG